MSVQRDVDAELRFHFESRIEELVAQGATPNEARARAIEEFGDIAATRDQLHEIDRRVAKRRSRLDQLEAFVQDLQYAARSLRRSATVSITVILTLALGIGVNAAMFSLLDVIYLRPPAAVVAPGELRRIWVEHRFVDGPAFFAGFDYGTFQSMARSVEGRADALIYQMPLKERIDGG